ncbi:MAG: hypothetical protein M5U09_22060 [Gammaproteobacteria bacterium]|nr:hypothetical protein [Gammaproteobacteria bacterium]
MQKRLARRLLLFRRLVRFVLDAPVARTIAGTEEAAELAERGLELVSALDGVKPQLTPSLVPVPDPKRHERRNIVPRASRSTGETSSYANHIVPGSMPNSGNRSSVISSASDDRDG